VHTTTTAAQGRRIGTLLVLLAAAVFGAGSGPTVAAATAEPVAAAAPFQPPRTPPVLAPQRSAAQQAADALARARAQAAKREAQLALAGQRARAIWEARGRPIRLVVVRPDTIDLVTVGRLTRRVPRPPGALSLTALNRALPRSWMSITDGTANLSAAVVLTPRVILDVGGDVTTVKLAGGRILPQAAAVYTGSGRLVLHGVTVTSADRKFQQPLAASPGRPFIVVSPGGRLEATDAIITDLGTSSTDSHNRAGVQFNTGSSGSVVRTTFLRNSTGLQLVGSQNVQLQDLTVGDSVGDGLSLTGNSGTVMSGIRAVRNGGDGVRLSGATIDRPITGITAAQNGGFGITAIRLHQARIEGVRTADNGSGGLEIYQTSGVTVSGLTAENDPVGVVSHNNCTDITLDRLTVTGGRRGVAIEKTTRHLTLTSSTIERAKVAGVAVGGVGVELRDVTVRDSNNDVRIERGANGVSAVGLQLAGGQDGLVAHAGTTGLVVDGLNVRGVANTGLRSASPDARIVGGSITGATTGITVTDATTISGTSISRVYDGIRVRSDRLVHADEVDIDAVRIGIDTTSGSPFLLSGSRVHALEAVRGDLTEQRGNDLSLPPLNLLGAIGIPLIVLAMLLQLVHLVRTRGLRGRTPRWSPPSVPTASVRRSLSRSASDTAPPRRPRRRRLRRSRTRAVGAPG
jgi:hypothetical protein